ncbi:hypothetical protein T4D_14302 [Trichinella pseudospiralis]|uniref:Uncharacterized protein n=1 Tax=Trichinella pseudospiralis TaxID=6337 RepID=A0A0V1G4D0_TRIPS|nr:hypothetical protein T4D_14302 [Trichinella pseudospiralis]
MSEILLVAHGLPQISTCVQRYGSGPRPLVLLTLLSVVESSTKSTLHYFLLSSRSETIRGLIADWRNCQFELYLCIEA